MHSGDWIMALLCWIFELRHILSGSGEEGSRKSLITTTGSYYRLLDYNGPR